MRDLLVLAGRVLIAALFVPAGYQTLSNIAGSTAYFDGLDLPLPHLAAWGVGFFELGMGLLILIGLQTRAAAVLVALFAAAAAYAGHFGQGGADLGLVMMHSQMFWKDIAIAGGLLTLAAHGAGAYSLDARRM